MIDCCIELLCQIYKKIKMQQREKSDMAEERNRRIRNIRGSLSKIPIISKNSLKIQKKIKSAAEQPRGNFVANSPQSVGSFTPLIFSGIKQASLLEEKYEVCEKIGQGANGFVNKCNKIDTGKVYALKSMMMDEQHIMELKQNFLAIRRLDHPHIIKYKALYIDMRKKLCSIVMEYVDLPSLDKIKIDSEEDMKYIIYQLLESVKYLHENRISHRDLKPENVLYNKYTKQIKIIDFGTAKKYLRRQTKVDMLTITGTLFYRAPEMFSGGGYDEKVDIWAIGVLLYWMVTRRTPFESPYLSDTINRIKDQQPNFSDDVWKRTGKGLRNLIKRMLQKDKMQRLTAAQCLRDVWFYSLTFQKLSDLTRSYQQHLFQVRNAQFGKKIMRKRSRNYLQPDLLNHSITKVDGQDYHKIESDDELNYNHKCLGNFDETMVKRKLLAKSFG